MKKGDVVKFKPKIRQQYDADSVICRPMLVIKTNLPGPHDINYVRLLLSNGQFLIDDAENLDSDKNNDS
jgi:hypothetical protein